jgi:hypothetical protein
MVLTHLIAKSCVQIIQLISSQCVGKGSRPVEEVQQSHKMICCVSYNYSIIIIINIVASNHDGLMNS